MEIILKTNIDGSQLFSLQTIRMGADLVEMLRDVIFYLGLMSPACFEDLVLGLNFSNVPCLKVRLVVLFQSDQSQPDGCEQGSWIGHCGGPLFGEVTSGGLTSS